MKYSVLVGIFLNFVGWEAIGLSDINQYEIFDGVKSIFGCLILIFFIYQSWNSVNILKHTMMEAIKYSQHPKRTEKLIEKLNIKYHRFVIVLSLATIGLFINAILAFSSQDKRLMISFMDQIEPIDVFLKVIYLFGLFLIITFFQIPKTRESSELSLSSDFTKRVQSAVYNSKLFICFKGQIGSMNQNISNWKSRAASLAPITRFHTETTRADHDKVMTSCPQTNINELYHTTFQATETKTMPTDFQSKEIQNQMGPLDLVQHLETTD